MTARKATSRLEVADLDAALELEQRERGVGALAHLGGLKVATPIMPGTSPSPFSMQRLELELLAHAVDARVQLRDARRVRLPVRADGDHRAGAQPDDPGRRHEDLRLEHRRVDDVDQRLAGLHALRALDPQARHPAAERRRHVAVRQLRAPQRDLAARLVGGRRGDRHLELARRAERLQLEPRNVRFARAAIVRFRRVELRALLAAVELDQGRAALDFIAQADVHVPDPARHLARQDGLFARQDERRDLAGRFGLRLGLRWRHLRLRLRLRRRRLGFGRRGRRRLGLRRRAFRAGDEQGHHARRDDASLDEQALHRPAPVRKAAGSRAASRRSGSGSAAASGRASFVAGGGRRAGHFSRSAMRSDGRVTRLVARSVATL